MDLGAEMVVTGNETSFNFAPVEAGILTITTLLANSLGTFYNPNASQVPALRLALEAVEGCGWPWRWPWWGRWVT